MCNVIDERPSDATTRTGVDETILWTCIEGIFAIDKLGMQHNVTLLGFGTQVGQTLPVHEVLGAGDAAGGGSCAEVARLAVVVAFYAEKSIDPAILMLGKAHVIDIGGRSIERFGNGEERLAVVAFDTHYQNILVAPLECAGVEGGVDADALHEERIRFGIIVIAPKQGRMGCRNNRKFVTVEDAVAFDWIILARHEGFMLCLDEGFALIEIHCGNE